MFLAQDAHNRWYVVLDWTGYADEFVYRRKEDAEKRMRYLEQHVR